MTLGGVEKVYSSAELRCGVILDDVGVNCDSLCVCDSSL